MRPTPGVLDTYQCQITLDLARDCHCMRCTLWRIELATKEQERAEQAKPVYFSDFFPRLKRYFERSGL